MKGRSGIIFALVLVLIIGVVVGGFWTWKRTLQTSESASAIRGTGKPMSVGVGLWPGLYWITIAREKGWFEEAGLNIEYFDWSADYYQSLQDVVDGKLDNNNFPPYDLLLANTKGAKLVGVTLVDMSLGVDGLVARKGINNIQDLVAKKIGVTKNTYAEYFLQEILAYNGLTIDQVKLVDVDVEKTTDVLRDGIVDAVVSWEPLMSDAVDSVGAKIIFDSSKIPGIFPGIQVFRQDFIESRPDDVQAYLSVWHKTTQYIHSNPKEAYKVVADSYDIPVNEVEEFAKQDQILSLDDAKTRMTYAAGFDSVHGLLQQINLFMIDRGITKKSWDTNEMIDSRFINSIEE